MKVKQVLIFVLFVIAALGLLMLVFPKDGIKIGKDLTLHFPSFSEFFFTEDEPYLDIDSIMALNIFDADELLEEEDSIEPVDVAEMRKKIPRLEYPRNQPEALDNFFAKLRKKSSADKVRILHYGDSQIEGDRITAFLRNRLQNRFGGKGMGLTTAGALYSQFSIIQTNSDNWERYQGFMGQHKVRDKKYGAMISFSRFSPLIEFEKSDELEQDSVSKLAVDSVMIDSLSVSLEKDSSEEFQDTVLYKAWLDFKRSNLAYSNTKQFKNIRIFYGNSRAKTKINLLQDDELIYTDWLKEGEGLHEFVYTSPEYLENIKMEFESYDSPDFYAISFEDDNGLFMDNIALRGSSGTFFSLNDIPILSQMYAKLDVDLLILQFGGNVMPYIETEEAAKRHANYFNAQINLLKRLIPDVDVIVIGPSDMSIKEKEKYITYPILETVVDELKDATHRAGGVYWDMYRAMGGKNSMVAWVHADPQLAANDYTHFTPQGTNVIANMFYNALILEYNSYTSKVKVQNEDED